MRIASNGREYAKWGVTANQSVPLDVSFDGTTWYPLERPADGEARVLVAGPDAVTNPAGTVVLQAGFNSASIRLVSTPETVVRSAGLIYVFEP